MKVSEMNSNQKKVFLMAVEAVNEYIGGWENTRDDYEEDTEEYKEAVRALSKSHEELTDEITGNVRISKEWERIEHLHFVGLDFLRERVSRRLTKYGY